MKRLALAILVAPILTGASSPKFTTDGQVSIDLERATLRGSVCLINRPTRANAQFSLNAGLNVARVRDGAGRQLDFEGLYNPSIDGEARVYEINPPAPKTLCVDYIGSFPSYPKHDGPTDFKGLIAFDGRSIRATEQSAWLPAPFDPTAKQRISTTAYDLFIKCRGCRLLYLNGLYPRSISAGEFRSSVARPPLLFGGRGRWKTFASVTFVNENPSRSQAASLAKAFRSIEDYYASYLGEPIKDKPTLLRMNAIDQSERNKNHSRWAFATWPTIAVSGSVARLADELETPKSGQDDTFPYLAHEMGHYYFGMLNEPTGPYRWMLLESMAEFLSVKAVGAIEGHDREEQRLSKIIESLSNKRSFRPLDKITAGQEIDGVYRYRYIPLLLVSLEKRIGPTVMQSFVKALLQSPSPRSWTELTQIAVGSGVPSDEWRTWQRECVSKGDMTCVQGAIGLPRKDM